MAEKNPAKSAALLSRFKSEPFYTNENVLAQVWRDPSKQVNLSKFIKYAGIIVEPVSDGKSIGRLLKKAGLTDVVDASVALMGLSRNDVVLTSDPEDLHKFGVTLIAI